MRKLAIFFTAVVLALGLSGCFSDRYSTSNVGVGVSSVSVGGIDLKDQLDVSILPAVLEEIYAAGLEQKLKGEELQKFVVRRLSEKIREISTVDLDSDDVADPVMVVPEGNEEQMTYSVRVPNPDEVSTLPSTSDAGAWQDIAENKSVELVALTAFPRSTGTSGKVSKVEFEARPSESFYPSTPYYHRSYSSGLLQYFILRDIFFRPYWYGPGYYGWYGGHYRPYSVSRVSSTRTVSRYSSGKSSYNRMKTNSGKTPSRSPSSLNASKKSFSVAKNRSGSKGGFGRSSSSSSRSGGFGRSSSSRNSGSSRSSSSRYSGSGGFGRSSSSGRGFFSGSSSGGGSRWGK